MLKRQAITKAVDLGFEEWVMIYQHPERPNPKKRSQYENADNVLAQFKASCKQLKIKVEDPHFIELESENDYAEIKAKLLNYMMDGPNSVFRHPKIVVVVLQYENNYRMYKELF